ncbi:hypothetical protein HMPREF9151_01508 [Hoylesella saccharolytica F0055]|uniref:Uncharacterized protein n=1 Tax=Hoylesella saccharolytica F0055 TaxID=1127699 RepID=L1N9L3_9BACT|nr:hypothetical protein HMPREF9151_01508 [Hoylesella saccharolytica F0055]
MHLSPFHFLPYIGSPTSFHPFTFSPFYLLYGACILPHFPPFLLSPLYLLVNFMDLTFSKSIANGVEAFVFRYN